MPNNINNHNSSCDFARQIVEYIYDEANAKDRSEFETHLINCSDCADELAGFGAVRSSIGDWREAFFALDAPVIEISYLKQSNHIANQTVSTEKRSRIAGFRNLFSLSPMWRSASAAFAVLVVCAGIALFVFVFSGNKNELAVNANQQIAAPVSPANSIENDPSEKVEIESSKEAPVELSNAEVVNSQPNNKRQNKRNSQVDPVTKIADNASKPKTISPKSNNLTVRPETNASNENKTPNKQKRQAPKLSDLSEEEDKKSLRLADLFDEIGAE